MGRTCSSPSTARRSLPTGSERGGASTFGHHRPPASPHPLARFARLSIPLTTAGGRCGHLWPQRVRGPHACATWTVARVQGSTGRPLAAMELLPCESAPQCSRGWLRRFHHSFRESARSVALRKSFWRRFGRQEGSMPSAPRRSVPPSPASSRAKRGRAAISVAPLDARMRRRVCRRAREAKGERAIFLAFPFARRPTGQTNHERRKL